MKNLILAICVSMTVMLLIGTFLYENHESLSPPYENIDSDHSNEAEGIDEPKTETLQPVNNDMIDYTLQNNKLTITYNNGQDWVKVPLDIELLFSGEYSGNKEQLIDGSYILTEDFAAFLYPEDLGSNSPRIILKYSHDQGETWNDGIVADVFPQMRFRKIDFLNDKFGYVILSGGRTMSEEYSLAFLTNDGGETWTSTTEPPTTRLIAYGGFVDESTGFLSYGTINPEEPDVFVTQDGGETWEQAVFRVPEEYEQVFVQAEELVKEDDYLSVFVNQGPNGDYAGGLVKGKFISEDNGLTWDFQREVKPDETE